jgi:hypothetical protein
MHSRSNRQMPMRPMPLPRASWLAAALLLAGVVVAEAQPANRREFIYLGNRLLATVRPDNPATVAAVAPTASIGEAAGSVNVGVRVTTTAGVTVDPITIAYATANGTAVAGLDYTPRSGVLTFPLNSPNGAILNVNIPILNEVPPALDEDDETFTLTLSAPNGAALGASVTTVTILDDDPLPNLSVADGAGPEGDEGASTLGLVVALAPPSGRTVSVPYSTSGGTATAGTDYTPASGVVTLPPGQTSATVNVGLVPDASPEPNETFNLNLGSPVNATVTDGLGVATILNDDPSTTLTEIELSHQTDRQVALAPAPPVHWYRIGQKPHSSYEVVVDATTGDIAGALPLAVERVRWDQTTVLQQSTAIGGPAGIGFTRSLRWQNSTSASVNGELIRVVSTSCNPCFRSDIYRVRTFDTTYAIPRFNNVNGQATILIVQNLGGYAISGTIWFWDSTGTLLASHPLSLAARGQLVLQTAAVPGVAGASGAITISHDARFGDLAGKAVSIDPANGFEFDTPMGPRQ